MTFRSAYASLTGLGLTLCALSALGGCAAGSDGASTTGAAGASATGAGGGIGAAGSSGPGAAGSTGTAGASGAAGSTGTAGASATGAAGTSGAAGAPGAAGASATGAAGKTGAGGSPGAAGSLGSGGAATPPGGSGGASAAAGAIGSGGASARGGTTGAAGGGLPASAIIVQDNFNTSPAGGGAEPTRWAAYPQGQESLAPVIDTARFHSAPNAARVTSTSSGLGSFLVPASGLPTPGNAFYVRVYMNWEKGTTSISGHSGFLVGAAGRQNAGTEVRLGLSSKGPGNVPRMDLNLQMPTDGGGETTRYSNGFTDGGNPADFPGVGFQFTANIWYCVEAFFNGASSGSEFRVWVNGSEITEMHVTDFKGSAGASPRTLWAPTYQYLKIGAQDYDANLGRIWYDDVVVATQPIGCNYLP